MLYFLYKIHEKEILPYIKAYAEIIKLIGEKDFTYIEDLLIYILEKGESEKMEEVLITFQETVSDSKKGKVMTIAEQLIEKGRQEGIKKVAINMLLRKLDKKIIAESTGLSIEEIERLKN